MTTCKLSGTDRAVKWWVMGWAHARVGGCGVVDAGEGEQAGKNRTYLSGAGPAPIVRALGELTIIRER